MTAKATAHVTRAIFVVAPPLPRELLRAPPAGSVDLAIVLRGRPEGEELSAAQQTLHRLAARQHRCQQHVTPSAAEAYRQGSAAFTRRIYCHAQRPPLLRFGS